MATKYADYDDLIRDLDHEGMSDDPFAGRFEDDDLALLSSYSPDHPRPKKRPVPVKKPARKTSR